MLAKSNPKARDFSTSKQYALPVKEEVKNKIRPRKSLGQNFLLDKNIIQKMTQTAAIAPEDIILEIGPGTGCLTFAMANKVKKIYAIEKDKNLAEQLKIKIKEQKINNIKIIEGDFLKIPLPKIKNYKVVANLPFNIAAACIMKLLTAKNQPSFLAVMTQKEVGQKIIATPPKMSKLSVFSQLLSESKLVSFVPANAFWPRPRVESAIIAFKTKPLPPNFAQITAIIRAGFQNPRKTILNNLNKFLKLDKCLVEQWLKNAKISVQQRPGSLTIEDWVSLANACGKVNCFEQIKSLPKNKKN
jgi:16S rRNA (adenine1518-N6/adenine1519-N6)-dimethyltransferase